jgi:actin-related protein 5
MAKFAQRGEELNEAVTTKAMYEEWGAERMKAWMGGNWAGAMGVDD